MEFDSVFRESIGFYQKVKTVNVEEYIFIPVIKKYWKQCELWDGTYTLSDFLDIMEIIQVQSENELREYENEKINSQILKPSGGG